MPQYTYPYAMNGINTATANPTVQMGYPYPNVPIYEIMDDTGIADTDTFMYWYSNMLNCRE